MRRTRRLSQSKSVTKIQRIRTQNVTLYIEFPWIYRLFFSCYFKNHNKCKKSFFLLLSLFTESFLMLFLLRSFFINIFNPTIFKVLHSLTNTEMQNRILRYQNTNSIAECLINLFRFLKNRMNCFTRIWFVSLNSSRSHSDFFF